MYVFDTDVLSLLMKGRLPDAARLRIANVAGDRAATTSITIGELYYGAFHSASITRWLDAINKLMAVLTCLPFEEESAKRYGELRAHLERKGRRLADPDLRIAAITCSGGHTLVSGNAKHFERVPGLSYENWLSL